MLFGVIMLVLHTGSRKKGHRSVGRASAGREPRIDARFVGSLNKLVGGKLAALDAFAMSTIVSSFFGP